MTSLPAQTEPPLDCALAEKYRRRLVLLPREYRAVHGAEMLQVFLESARDADPENADLTYRLGSPGWRETSALVALALRLRWTAPADDSRFAARAAGLRLFTSAVVVLLAAMSVQQTVSAIALLVHPPADWETVSLGASMWQTLVPTDDWWRLTAGWVHLAWIAVMVLLGLGTRIALRVATALAAVPTVVLAIGILSTVMQSGAYGIAGSIGWLAVDIAAVLGLAAVASYVRSAEHAGAGAVDAAAAGAHHTRHTSPDSDVDGSPSWPGELSQPRRLRLHLAVTGLAAAPSVLYIVAAIATRLPIAVYVIAIPLTDLPSFFSLAAVVATAVALARRNLPRPFAYALAGLGAAAALLQATGLDLWVILARSEFPAGDPSAPYASLCLALAITALALDVLIAVIAITLARRTRVRI